MKKVFPWRSRALAFALLPAAVPISMAQDAPGLEEVVVTGSLIRGTPEDAALPVEVFNSAELQELGDPTPLEFVKNLSISGPTTGEAYYFSGSDNTNSVRFNLRGIGDDKTLTLFNGRRAFQNSVVYPSGAIERIEILKDGAAVTYGADATGGVVNMITKENFDGFDLSASYKTYDGSDEGEWKVGAVAGFDTEFANLLFAVEWDHRSELHSYDRDFATRPYGENPAPTSLLTNVAAWLPRGALPADPAVSGADGRGEWGNPVGSYQYDFTQSSCEAVGGTYVPLRSTTTPNVAAGPYPWHSCAYNYIGYYNLVEENDVHRVFAQLNSKISDSSDFTLRALWARNYSPHQYGSPAQPVTRGPAINTGATFQLYVPSVNPYALEFAQRSGWANQTVAGFPALAVTRGYTPALYRVFAHGGNDTFASGDNHSTPNSNETKYWHINASVDGVISESVSYNIGATFNQYKEVNSQPDVLGYRLQEALNGFGGPNCNAVDMDPGRFGTQAVAAGSPDPGVRPAGCMWWNPFASNFPNQPVFGLANPSFVSGSQNPDELVDWVFNKREFEDNHYDFTFDAVFSGDLPLELPGGAIAWAVGGQYRTQKNRETVNDPLYNGQTPCDWPGQDPSSTTNPNGTPNTDFTGCTLDLAGPYLFFANNVPDATEQQQQSYFAELAFPILDNLNVSVAGRYEEFEPIGLDATVYKVSAKWQVVDQFALRGSYGTNYQAPGPDIIPGELTNTVASYTRAGGAWLGSTVYTRTDIEPETATVWNVGAILQLDWGTDQEFEFILDYFDIETEDELGLVSTSNDIANSVFDAATGYANCSHPLISRVTFNGPCRDATTDPGDQSVWTTGGGFASIRTDYGNGPGQHVAGFDLQINYGIGVGPGRLSLGAGVTKYTTNETTPTILDGFVVKESDDRLGYLNFATVGASQPEVRGNVFGNYNIGEHNVRLQVNYVSGVDDERFLNPDGSVNEAASGIRPPGYQPGTTNAYPISLFGVYGDDWISTDIHYLWRAPWATIGFSVINVADEDPPASRQEFSYDPRVGSPLGRQFELTLRKQF